MTQPNNSDKEGSVSICSLGYGVVEISQAKSQMTTSEIIFDNKSENWIVINVKFCHPGDFQFKPFQIALLVPKDCQPLEIGLSPLYHDVKNYYHHVETSVCTFNDTKKPPLHCDAIWKEIDTKLITRERFPIKICESKKLDAPRRFRITLRSDGNLQAKKKIAKIIKLMKQMREEGSIADGLIVLIE